MENTVVVDVDDMVNYICVQMIAHGMIVNDELVRAVLDAETDYYMNYATNEGEI